MTDIVKLDNKAIADVVKFNGIAKASMSKINGLTIPSAGYTVPTGMDGEWLFDGNAQDTSGNNYDGTATGVAYSTPSGASIQVAEFRATGTNVGDDVDIDSYASNFEYTNDFTVSFWAKYEVSQPGSTAAGVFAVTFDGSSGDYSGYGLYLFSSAGDVWWRCYDSTSTYGQVQSTTTGLNDGTTWRHYFLTKSSTDGMELSINNSSDGTDTSSNAKANIRYRASDVMNIGARHDASTGAVQGQVSGDICLFRIYPSVLGSSDRTNLYDEGVDLLGL